MLTELSPAEETVAELRAAVVAEATADVSDAVDRALYAAIQTLQLRLQRSGGLAMRGLSAKDRQAGLALANLVVESLEFDLPCDVGAIVAAADEHDVVEGDEMVIERVTNDARAMLRGLYGIE